MSTKVSYKKVPGTDTRYAVRVDGALIGYVERETHRNAPTGRHNGPSTGRGYYDVWYAYDLTGAQVARDYQRNWVTEKLQKAVGS